MPFVSVSEKIESVLNHISCADNVLPKIVLIGSQNSGKTAVIENIIEKNCLLSSESTKTRCPTILQIRNGNNFLAKFPDLPVTVSKAEEVPKIIKQITCKYAGNDNRISAKPIIIEICSQNMLRATIIDLPGLREKADSGPQIEDARLVDELTLVYITPADTIILVVISATTDIASDPCHELARKVDPTGSRTVVVVTKLDSAGNEVTFSSISNAVEGRHQSVIAIIGRCLKGNRGRKNSIDNLKYERKFLQSRYPNFAKDHGTAHLLERLSVMFSQQLLDILPPYLRKISDRITCLEQELRVLEDIQVEDPGRVLLGHITMYAGSFCAQLTGNMSEIETEHLVGGARISHFFREVFSNALDGINPLANLTRTQILTALRNTSGTRPDVLFIPEACFENLARRQVQLLAGPCRHCVDIVHEELLRLVRRCGNGMQEKYPKLYNALYTITTGLIDSGRRNCVQLVEELIQMELSFISTHDEGFQRDLDACKMKWLATRGLNNWKPEEPSAPIMPSNTMSSTSWLASLLARKSEETGDVDVTSQSSEVTITVTHEEDADGQLIENMIISYVNAVKRTFKDSIPKAIMLRMVEFVNRHLYSSLLENISLQKDYKNLLDESDQIPRQREQLTGKMKVLQIAERKLQQVQEELRHHSVKL